MQVESRDLYVGKHVSCSQEGEEPSLAEHGAGRRSRGNKLAARVDKPLTLRQAIWFSLSA